VFRSFESKALCSKKTLKTSLVQETNCKSKSEQRIRPERHTVRVLFLRIKRYENQMISLDERPPLVGWLTSAP